MALFAVDIITTLIDHFDKNVKGNKGAVLCFCSSDMQRIKASDCYNKSLSCDNCGKQVDGSIIAWHCPKEYNIFHPDGYDICNFCHIKDTNITEVSQHNLIPMANDSVNTDLSPNPLYQCQHKENCPALKNFITIIKQYDDHFMQIANTMDNAKLTNVVNDYLHLLHEHNDDEQFQFIVDYLGYCDIASCVKIKRHYRNRNIIDNTDCKVQKKYMYDVVINFMDKMHCYFQHCYDIGNRISIHEKSKIYAILNEMKQEHNDDPLYDILYNKKK
eukprot:553545_1